VLLKIYKVLPTYACSLQGVIICSPTDTHEKLVNLALEKGYFFFIFICFELHTLRLKYNAVLDTFVLVNIWLPK